MDLPKELLKDLEDRRVLLFLGSGASVSSKGTPGFPSAAHLAEKLCTELLHEPAAKGSSLAEIAQLTIWDHNGGRGQLEAFMTRIFSDPAVRPHRHHMELPLLGFPVITTNYDQLIELAYRSSGVGLSVILQDSDLPTATGLYLVKIHGCISRPSTCIISEDDYYRWLSEDSELKNLVRALFTTHRVVFVGYSLADVNFRLLLSELRSKVGPTLRRPYIVTPEVDQTSYNYQFAIHSLGACFIEATAAAFITSLAGTYGRGLVPYTDRYRSYYFQQSTLLNQSFANYAAERLLEDMRSNDAGPLQLDQAVVDRIFAIASSKQDELYGPFCSAPAPPGMVYVPPGEFIMGGSRLGNERLRVERIAEGFYIQQATVSNREYRVFAEHMRGSQDHTKCHPAEPANKNHWPDSDFSGAAAKDVVVVALPDDYFTNPDYDDYPVVNIDWWDAFAFASWMGWRLPTEQEWEKAARGIDGRTFPYGNTFDPSVSNVAETGIHKPVRLRTYPGGRSPYGCFEMSGNVWEWCADLFHGFSLDQCGTRVVRGGSCTRSRVKAATSFRNGRYLGDRWITRGFRCVLDQKNWRGGP